VFSSRNSAYKAGKNGAGSTCPTSRYRSKA
jgi:hypothetical protein